MSEGYRADGVIYGAATVSDGVQCPDCDALMMQLIQSYEHVTYHCPDCGTDTWAPKPTCGECGRISAGYRVNEDQR